MAAQTEGKTVSPGGKADQKGKGSVVPSKENSVGTGGSHAEILFWAEAGNGGREGPGA